MKFNCYFCNSRLKMSVKISIDTNKMHMNGIRESVLKTVVKLLSKCGKIVVKMCGVFVKNV